VGLPAVTLSATDRDWLTRLPKVELHCHLEGSMSVDTVSALAERHRADPTPIWPDGFPQVFSFDGFPSFATQFWFGLSLLRTGDDLAIVTADLACTLARQNVRYAEITTTAFTHFRGDEGRPGMSWSEYRDGLDEGRRRAADAGVQIGWIVDIPRDLELPEQTTTIDYLESNLTPDGLLAIGLGGYEVGFPAAPYAPHFARARAIGLHSVPHAGETEGAESVREAIDLLHAERIGHGVRAIEDPALVQQLVDRGIMLEVCPTSNVLLGVVNAIEEHPMPALRAAGVPVCLNTDDPGWFGTDLVTELAIATEHLGATRADHLAMQLDAVDAAFMDDATRTAIAAEIRSYT
jgi:aminodeoxyfutalosine deaminase